MALELEDDFDVFEARGVEVIRGRRRLGQRQEARRMARNAHWLRANAARRELLTVRQDGQPLQGDDSGDVVLYEQEVRLPEGRYGGASTGVSWQVDGEQILLTMELLDSDGTTVLDSDTWSATTRAQGERQLQPGQRQFILRLSGRAQPGQTFGLYGTRVRELVISDVADLRLGGFHPRNAQQFAAGQGYTSVETCRLVDAITDVCEQQMIGGGFTYRADRAPRWGAIGRLDREWLRFVEPEATALLLHTRYQVHGPGVEARWISGLRGNAVGKPTPWSTLSSAGARRTWQAQLEYKSIHDAGLDRFGCRLQLKSIVSDNPSDVHTYTVKSLGGYDNNGAFFDLDQDPQIDFEERDCARLRFFDSNGDELGAETNWQAQRFGDSRIYVFPWVPERINTSITTIEATLAGSITVYGVHGEEVHGRPYGGVGRRFLWDDRKQMKRPLVTGRPLAAPPHLFLYGAQEYLLTYRTPHIWGGYAQPEFDGDTRDRLEVKLGTDAPEDDWQTMARAYVGADATLKRTRGGVETRHQRRALEAFCVIQGRSQRAHAEGASNDPCPMLFRLRRSKADGTQTAVSGEFRLDVIAANLPRSILHQGDESGNIYGLQHPRVIGGSAHGLRIELVDKSAVEGEILELQVKPVLNEDGSVSNDQDGSGGFKVMLESWWVAPPMRAAWQEIAVDL